MKACCDWFDSISYVGIGRQGLARCITAFEVADKDKAIEEYRGIIGEAPNFASALTDLETDRFSPDNYEHYFNRVLGVMVSMSLLMGGGAK
jgi:hypothetical protein